MILTGGTFGVNGGARFGPDNTLEIRGSRGVRFRSEDITSAVASTSKNTGFSILSFLVLAIVLSLVLGFFLSVFGVVIALVVAIAASFRTRAQHVVDMEFTSGDRVTLQCNATEADQLIRLRRSTPAQ